MLPAVLSNRHIAPPPSGFGWAPPFAVAQRGRRFAVGAFDVRTYAPTGKTYYVSTTGNDAADGLTPATALRRINTAYTKADVVVVSIAPGLYTRQYAWNSILARSVAMINNNPAAGQVICTAHDPLSWTTDATYANTRKATRSSVVRVVDAAHIDANGDYLEYINAASATVCNTTPGSWFLDVAGGNTLYVRTSDGRAADADIWALLSVSNGRAGGDLTTYCEGIDFIGGSDAMNIFSGAAGQSPCFYAKNCAFKYAKSSSSAGNGVTIQGAVLTILQNCSAARNIDDGFNYHAYNGVSPKAIEISCVGRHNGAAGDTDNGSTSHDSARIVRINGSYYANRGPNVADVGGAQSWNLGCSAAGSTGAAGTGQQSNYQIDSSGGTIWLDRCVSGAGSAYDLYAAAGAIYARGLIASGVGNGGAGTMTTY